jgi:hypothetical protein
MKNALKLFGIIAIAAVIGFWAVSCGGDDGDDGGNAISGNTITSGAEVVYDSSIKNITEAINANNFGFTYDKSYNYGKWEPLNVFLDGSPSVTVYKNKVTIILGTPKVAFLNNMFGDIEGLTVNPRDAKSFDIRFETSDGKYRLICMKDDNNGSSLLYMDKDVTIKGSYLVMEPQELEDSEGIYEEPSLEIKFNASLKKGWNYLFYSYNEATKTETITSSTTQPSGFKWTVRSDK